MHFSCWRAQPRLLCRSGFEPLALALALAMIGSKPVSLPHLPPFAPSEP